MAGKKLSDEIWQIRADERFDALTDKQGKRRLHMKTRCWDWKGCVTLPNKKGGNGGYGLFGGKRNTEGRTQNVLAHRYAYVRSKGPIPDGKQIDHKCNNRRCVRPSHLRTLTPKQNSARRKPYDNGMAKRTHCPNGHERTEENRRVNAQGNTICSVCYPPRKKCCPRGHLKTKENTRVNSQGSKICTVCYTPGGRLREEFR